MCALFVSLPYEISVVSVFSVVRGVGILVNFARRGDDIRLAGHFSYLIMPFAVRSFSYEHLETILKLTAKLPCK